MADAAEKKPFYKKWWVWVIAVIVIAAIGSQQEGGEDTPAERAKLAEDPVILKRPDQQKNFVIITQEARKKGQDSSNDMQRGGHLNTRGKEICDTLKSLVVKDWTGWVKTVDSNSEGKGMLSIRLARNIHVQTWNNAFSDINYQTLIKPGSKVFQSASALKAGAKVKFSGSFFKDDMHCIAEQSNTLEGKIDDPEFTFRFSSVELLK